MTDQNELLRRAAQVLPGGVLGSHRSGPGLEFVVREGRGAYLFDLNGRRSSAGINALAYAACWNFDTRIAPSSALAVSPSFPFERFATRMPLRSMILAHENVLDRKSVV